AFSKLNAIYDREVTPRLKEGVFLDRQTFLLGLIDDHAQFGFGGADQAGRFEQSERWRFDRNDENGAVVLSTPLKTASGAALGSLYLKQMPGRHFYQEDDRLQVIAAVAGGTGVICLIFLWVLLPTWVYVDARERGVRRAP